MVEELIQIEHPHKKIKWDEHGNAYLDTESAETGENTHGADLDRSNVEFQETTTDYVMPEISETNTDATPEPIVVKTKTKFKK